jgi:type IV pilus biogenesis protein CpaD/CtpE
MLPAGCTDRFVETDVGLPQQRCAELSGSADAWRPGCATHRNMATIAADRRDLIRARAEAPRDAVRRDAVIAAYARGRPDGPSGATTPPALASTAGERGGSQ